MEYTILKLSRLANVSTRTLRYYDEIGLLKPVRVSSSGYRIYGKAEVDKLQQILFYRELGVQLENIQKIVNAGSFDPKAALREHYQQLLQKREQLDLLIKTVEKTIQSKEGRTEMSDTEKFEGFKQKMIDENEAKYGKEIREKYGADTVNKSNDKVKNMTQEQHQKVTELSETLMLKLAQAKAQGDPASPLAQEVAELHKEWLCYYWPSYSKEAHAGVAQMYVDDERFTAYYDKTVPGTAEFLRDAVWIYTGMNK